MRLPESKIKDAILHPDADIRERAVHYFAQAFSRDPSLVPLVIQAVEKYGREGAYLLVGACTDLAHTDDTISWVVDELDREDADQYENYTYNLTRVLCNADPALLVHRDTRIIEARHFLPSHRDAFLERLKMFAWDEAACWRELEAICQAGKDKDDTKDIELDRAAHVLEALARIDGLPLLQSPGTLFSRQIAVLAGRAFRIDRFGPLDLRLLGFIGPSSRGFLSPPSSPFSFMTRKAVILAKRRLLRLFGARLDR